MFENEASLAQPPNSVSQVSYSGWILRLEELKELNLIKILQLN